MDGVAGLLGDGAMHTAIAMGGQAATIMQAWEAEQEVVTARPHTAVGGTAQDIALTQNTAITQDGDQMAKIALLTLLMSTILMIMMRFLQTKPLQTKHSSTTP